MCLCFGWCLANNYYADTAANNNEDFHIIILVVMTMRITKTFCLGWGVTDYGDTAEDFPEKLLEVEVGL